MKHGSARMVPFLFVLALWAMLPSCENKASLAFVFKDAYLSKQSMIDLANKDGAAAVRIYNAARSASDQEGTVLAVGVMALLGRENSGTSVDKRYRLYDRLGTNTVVEQILNKTAAQTAARYIAVGKDRFCVELTKNQVNGLVSSSLCNAVKLESVLVGQYYTMKLTAVRVEGGVVTPVAGVQPVQVTDPCPLNCGDPPSLYLW